MSFFKNITRIKSYAHLFLQTGIEHLLWIIIKLLLALGTQKGKQLQSLSLMGSHSGGGSRYKVVPGREDSMNHQRCDDRWTHMHVEFCMETGGGDL